MGKERWFGQQEGLPVKAVYKQAVVVCSRHTTPSSTAATPEINAFYKRDGFEYSDQSSDRAIAATIFDVVLRLSCVTFSGASRFIEVKYWLPEVTAFRSLSNKV